MAIHFIACSQLLCSYVAAELEITVGHQPFLTIFRDLAEQTQFARTNLLHIINGEANNSL